MHFCMLLYKDVIQHFFYSCHKLNTEYALKSGLMAVAKIR